MTALFDFLSTSTQEIDNMAAAIMMQADSKLCSYQHMLNHVKLLQEYELIFWNSSDVVVNEFKALQRKVTGIALSA